MVNLKPFRSRVSILTREDDLKYYETERTEAEIFVRAGLAVQVADEPGGWVKAIRLTVSLSELHEHLTAKNERNRRPKPPMRAPQSSTGDAGRGLSPLVGHYRAIHFGPGPRL